MRKSLILVAGLVVCFVAMNASSANAWVAGDIFAAVNNGNVNVYHADGSFVQTLNTGQGGYTTGMAFDASGTLYVTNISASSVSRFASDGSSLGLWGSGYSTPESIVFNAAGEGYVGNLGNGILKFDAAGNPLTSYASGRTDWIDLASDQTTMYYTQEGDDILRYDLATNTQLTNFNVASLGGQAFALRILADGGVLLANGAEVLRLDAGGNVIQTYDEGSNNNWFSLNLNPDGTSFWSGDFGTGELHEFNLDGTHTQSINTGVGYYNLFGVAVFGEVTQGGPNPDPIPEPGTMALLGLGLAGIGSRLRRRK